jgi:hypothetical protein
VQLCFKIRLEIAIELKIRLNERSVYQLSVHGRRRVPLDPDDRQVEGGAQLRMGDVSLLESETRGPDEALELRRLPGEILRHEADLCHQSFPRFTALS